MNDRTGGSAEAISPVQPPLFRWLPDLQTRLPWVALTRVPSPVHPLANLGRELGIRDLWVKRDDRCGHRYGGNKPRKLEFLLGDAVARHASTVITFGALGSNHTLATAICGRQLGLHTVLILVQQPLSEGVRRNLLLSHAHGTEMVYSRGKAGAAWAAARHWMKHWAGSHGRLPYLIPPGGSSPRGCLGYVNAALELPEQIKAGDLPQPDEVLVPVGSNGTMAGLEVGLRLAGLEARVVGVRVNDRLPVSAENVARLANRCWSLLQRYASDLPPGRVDQRQVIVWHQYLGKGYAHPTPEGERALRMMADHEGIELDEVYTGKTLAALIDTAADPIFRDRRILFWNTFNSLPLSPLLPQGYDHHRLPKSFHHVFEAQ